MEKPIHHSEVMRIANFCAMGLEEPKYNSMPMDIRKGMVLPPM